MEKETAKSATWSTIRPQLATLEKAALLALVKDLYQSSTANRDFLHARFRPEEGGQEALETYVENGARFTQEYGSIDEPFYVSVETVLDELADLLRGAARGLYPQFKFRLTHLKHISSEIGWGFGDHVQEVVDELKEELGAGARFIVAKNPRSQTASHSAPRSSGCGRRARR